MKKILISLVIGIVLGAGLLLLVQYAGAGVIIPERTLQSSEKTSFPQTTSHLDPGGDVYLFLNTKKLVAALDKHLEEMRDLFVDEESMTEQKLRDGEVIFDLMERFILHCGLNEINGIGTSTIRLKNQLNRSKLVLHRDKSDSHGLLWNLFKEKPHRLDMLDLLPANTVFASFNDFRPQFIWQWLKKQIGESDLFPVQKVVVIMDAALKMQGISLDQLLPELDGEIGTVITLNPEKKSHFPLAGGTAEINDYSAAIVISVKDNKLLNLLRMVLPQTDAGSGKESVGKKNRYQGFHIRLTANPFKLSPVVAQKNGLLIVATHMELVDDIWAAKTQKKGLIAADFFKELSLEMPLTGNGFRFIHPRFIQTLLKLYKASLLTAGKSGESLYTLTNIVNPLPPDMQLFSVVKNTRNGLIVTANHNIKTEVVMSTPLTSVIALGLVLTPNPVD